MLTVYLDYTKVEDLSNASGLSMTDVIRTAVDTYLRFRLADEELLQRQINASRLRFETIISRLNRRMHHELLSQTGPTPPARSGPGISRPVRLDQASIAKLEALALVDSWTVDDEIRAATEYYLSRRQEESSIVREAADGSSILRLVQPE